jgi:hypothetical protein
MVIRLKNASIDAIEQTETKRLKLLKFSAKDVGTTLSLELPEALCDSFSARDTVDVIIDSKPIVKGEGARLYAQGNVFKVEMEKDLEVVGTLGGLRFVLKLSKPTAAKKKTFDLGSFYIALV